MPGRYDSSITRVAPVLHALRVGGHLPGSLARLLELPARDGRGTREWPEPGELEEAAWWPREKRLDPPRELLEYLVRALAGSARPTSVPERTKLFAGDEDALNEALEALQGVARPRAWYVFEGPTSVDAYVRTSRFVVVLEGKRTESGPTTHTSWMEVRHQVLRNIDAAWDERGDRELVALLAVEGSEPDPTAVPPRWREAAQATVTEEALAGSLPHRKEETRRQMADSFLGAVTWQAICRTFDLPPETLLDEVPPSPS
jgi:hypothetical protein